MPIEYILARASNGGGAGGAQCQGQVITSEFISCARVMRGSLVVNPWRLEEVRAELEGWVR